MWSFVAESFDFSKSLKNNLLTMLIWGFFGALAAYMIYLAKIMKDKKIQTRQRGVEQLLAQVHDAKLCPKCGGGAGSFLGKNCKNCRDSGIMIGDVPLPRASGYRSLFMLYYTSAVFAFVVPPLGACLGALLLYMMSKKRMQAWYSGAIWIICLGVVLSALYAFLYDRYVP